jgi:hypothetical protein
LQHLDPLFECIKPLLKLNLDLGAILSELSIKVFSVRRGAHSGTEDGLDNKGVVGFEGICVGATEGVCELFGFGGYVAAEGLGGEVKTTVFEK